MSRKRRCARLKKEAEGGKKTNALHDEEKQVQSPLQGEKSLQNTHRSYVTAKSIGLFEEVLEIFTFSWFQIL